MTKPTRANILIIQMIKALQDVMATSFPKNQGNVQVDTVVRMMEDFAENHRFMWRHFVLRPEPRETTRARIRHEIASMEPRWLKLSDDAMHVKLTDLGFVEANEFPGLFFSRDSVYKEITSQFV